MIQSFKDEETKLIFNRQRSRKLDQSIQVVAFRKLRMLHRSKTLNDLRIPPANRLEKLKGDRANQYSIHINDQYRICLEWRDGNAYQVDIVDYH